MAILISINVKGQTQEGEVWQSKLESDQWFAKYVVPNLPPGIHPKRSYQELHSIVTPFE